MGELIKVGVDCGMSGGIAWRESGEAFAVAMPKSRDALVSLIGDICHERKVVAWVEDVPMFCGKNLPASRLGKLFHNQGLVEGMLAALGATVYLVRPQDWQKQMGCGTSRGLTKTEWKNNLKAKAVKMFPELRVTLKTADALLLLALGEQTK